MPELGTLDRKAAVKYQRIAQSKGIPRDNH